MTPYSIVIEKKKIQVAESEKGNKPREMEIGVFMIYFVINLLNCVVTAVFYLTVGESEFKKERLHWKWKM